MKPKNVKVVAQKPKHYKSLIRAQFAITYVDSEILGPLGRLDPLIHSFDCEGSIVQPLPKQFRLQMVLQAVPVRGKKPPVNLLVTPDIMGGGQLFHRPYTKAEIKKMQAEEAARVKKEEEEYRDYDDRDYDD